MDLTDLILLNIIPRQNKSLCIQVKPFSWILIPHRIKHTYPQYPNTVDYELHWFIFRVHFRIQKK